MKSERGDLDGKSFGTSWIWPVITAALFFGATAGIPVVSAEAGPASPLSWSRLADIPVPLGLGSPFAGVSGGALIVAGGANFSEGMPWDGGKKMFCDGIYILEKMDGAWKTAEIKLPRPLANGVSVTCPSRDSILLIGGDNADGVFADVYELKYTKGRVTITSLPSLPKPIAYSCGVRIGQTIYIAGGRTDLSKKEALAEFWALDLAAPSPAWTVLPWPKDAPARHLASMGVLEDQLYLAGGSDLGAATWDGRTYLNDAYRFNPKTGTWNKLAAIEFKGPDEKLDFRSLTAAPFPAIPIAGNLHFPGGAFRAFVDRADVKDSKGKHPGFPSEVLAYRPADNAWSLQHGVQADLPASPPPPPENPRAKRTWAPVCTPVVEWQQGWVLPSGEISPGIRSPQVLFVRQSPNQK